MKRRTSLTAIVSAAWLAHAQAAVAPKRSSSFLFEATISSWPGVLAINNHIKTM